MYCSTWENSVPGLIANPAFDPLDLMLEIVCLTFLAASK